MEGREQVPAIGNIAQRDREAYRLALRFLEAVDDRVTSEMVQQHASKSEYDRPDELPTIFRRLLESASNAQMKRNVIGSVSDLTEALSNFDPFDILERYERDPSKLQNHIVENTKRPRDLRLTDKSIWPRYCRSIISGALFVSQFPTGKDFHGFASLFQDSVAAIPALPLLISKEVYGFGFALACDFLKEIGYLDYAKPDTHLKGILSGLHLCQTRDDYDVFKAVVRIAKHVGVAPYAVDKVFWLIGSGRFYRVNLNVGRHGNQFIEWAQPRLR